MTEEELEHLIRASGAIINDDAVIVIGSQSILPWLRRFANKVGKEPPQDLVVSMEADIIPIDNDPHKSDLIDGSIGEETLFHKTFEIYAQGVSLETARAPAGWQSRCYPLKSRRTNGIVGYCMHPADLFVAKTMAGRPKDGAFLNAMIRYGLVREKTVRHLVAKVPGLSEEEITEVRKKIAVRFEACEQREAGEKTLAETKDQAVQEPQAGPRLRLR